MIHRPQRLCYLRQERGLYQAHQAQIGPVQCVNPTTEGKVGIFHCHIAPRKTPTSWRLVKIIMHRVEHQLLLLGIKKTITHRVIQAKDQPPTGSQHPPALSQTLL
jgi:hypothetical protein